MIYFIKKLGIPIEMNTRDQENDDTLKELPFCLSLIKLD